MKTKLEKAKSLFWLIAPLVTSSFLGVSPTLAATFASSQGGVNLKNFSQAPKEIFTVTDTEALAIANDNSKVEVEADAQAVFISPSPAMTQASNISESKAAGEGSNYLGIAQSVAEVTGYDFLVDQGEEFAFDFDSALVLKTSVDDAQFESAIALGLIDLKLYDATDSNNLKVIDYFTLSGNLVTPGEDDFIIPKYSENFTVEEQTQTIVGKNREYVDARLKGFYSRYFDNLTYLTLVEETTNKVTVKTPEASNLLGLLYFGFIFVRYGLKNKV